MTAYSYQRILLAVRILLILSFIGIFGFLVSRDLVLSGKISYTFDFLRSTPFFSEAVPLDRTEKTSAGVRIIDEPVYVSLFYPRPFQQVDVQVEFSNPDLLFLEMGPLTGIPETYDRQALYHPQLEQLTVSSDWLLSDNDLFQRQSADYRYASADQLFDQPAAQQLVGYYGFDWPTPYLPEFTSQREASILYPLHGPHKTLIALNQDQLDLRLTVSSYHDLAGDDHVTVRLRDWQGNELAVRRIDQEERPLGVTGNKLTEELQFTGLTYPAVYRLDIETTNDTVIHELEVNTPYLVFDGSIRLAGGPQYEEAYGSLDISGSSLISGARSWHAVTESFDSLQTLRMADASVTLARPLEAVRFSPARSFRFLINRGYEIYLQKGDVMLQGKGVFAMTQNAYFNPYPWFVDGSLDPDLLGIDYVAVQYRPVERDGSRFRQTINVDLAKAFAPEKQLRMQIAAPRMFEGQSFELHRLEAHFSSEPVTFSNAKEKFIRFFKREILR